MFSRSLVAAAALALPAALTGLHAQVQPRPAAIDFERDVRPILQKNCYECHDARKQKARLRLDSLAAIMKGSENGAIVIPGNSDKSPMVRRLLGLDGEDRMPKDEDPLPAAQIALIRAWIDQSAAVPPGVSIGNAGPQTSQTAGGGAGLPSPVDDAPQHWAYRVPVRPELPAVKRAGWARTPVDRFVLARLESEGLAPSAEAALDTLVRRVSLDLIGLPPSPKEVDDVRADAASNGVDAAYERLVDRLLASPHYGERWARPWLDLARYADSQGYEKDLPRVMWKYRDWVINALNQDMPFDQFTIEQIAGDMLPNATTEQLVASGFHRNSMTNEEGGIDPDEALYEVLVDRVNTTATVWLGTTLGCAQCHNHKYDPFTQKDYYRLMAFFQNADYQSRTFSDGTRFSEAIIDLPTPEQETKRKVIQTEIDKLTDEMKVTTPAFESAQAEWEAATKSEVALHWTTLTPQHVEATGGVRLTAALEESIIASGANPSETTYTIEAFSTLPRITAIRLEALPDASLPKGGPGRDIYGNFQMNGFEIEAAAGTKLAISSIKADDSAGGASVDAFFPKTLPRGAHAPRGWLIDASRETPRRPRQIVFTLEQPLVAPAGTRLTIRLKHEAAAVGQAIGRFRLSATSSRTPERIVQLPARLRPVLAIPTTQRTEQQQKDVVAFYRTIAPLLKPARDQIADLQKQLRALGIPTALVMRERTSYERPSAYVRRRGAFMDKGELVYAGVPAILHPLRDDQMPNRLGLARWLIDERNPLTARVTVNRAWEQFFGHGIVETSEDFGTQGSQPSHPALLDWLATEFVGGGWRMKPIHKAIVMSATYRQSSAATPTVTEKDPYNRLLARGPRFRMEAEMVRDSVLAASGLLSATIGGPSVFPPQPDGIWDIPYSSEKWIPSGGDGRYRRGLYVFIRRSAAYPSFMTFDATSREHTTVRRVRTNTPLQALVALNDEAFFEAAQAMAARVLREAPAAANEARATYAFRLAATRAPSAAEVARICASLEKELQRFRKDPAAAAKTIQGRSVDGIDPAEQAAWTLVANALLNLDETFSKE